MNLIWNANTYEMNAPIIYYSMIQWFYYIL